MKNSKTQKPNKKKKGPPKKCQKKVPKKGPQGSQNRTFVDIVFAITVSIFRGHFAAIRGKDFLADLYWLKRFPPLLRDF